MRVRMEDIIATASDQGVDGRSRAATLEWLVGEDRRHRYGARSTVPGPSISAIHDGGVSFSLAGLGLMVSLKRDIRDGIINCLGACRCGAVGCDFGEFLGVGPRFFSLHRRDVPCSVLSARFSVLVKAKAGPWLFLQRWQVWPQYLQSSH